VFDNVKISRGLTGGGADAMERPTVVINNQSNVNAIQISALLVFSVMTLGYRMNHPP
jgi:hypothetical protein